MNISNPARKLGEIARRFDTTAGALARLNDIRDPDRIRPGQSLRLPAAVEPMTHTVQRGDTLGAIAQRYGTTVDALARRNNISYVNLIDVGQVLTLPAGSGPRSRSVLAYRPRS